MIILVPIIAFVTVLDVMAVVSNRGKNYDFSQEKNTY